MRLCCLLRAIVTFCFIGSAISPNPSCKCIRFDAFDYEERNGTFQSPDYPEKYPRNSCFLYEFIGTPREIVKLTFHQLHLPHKVFSNGVCSDYIAFYLNLSEPMVNEMTPYQKLICGIHNSSPFTVYSKGRALVFEFFTDSETAPDDVGFLGHYSFIKKEKYRRAGVKHAPSVCDYEVSSTRDVKEGQLFSPSYPSPYPAHIVCTYEFIALPGEHVIFTLRELNLPVNFSSCSRQSTYVLIYDTAEPWSALSHDAVNKTRKLGRYCYHSSMPETVVSTGRRLVVQFFAGENKDSQGQGFKADYEFTPNPSLELMSTSAPVFGQSLYHCDSTYLPSQRSGVLTSPQYPKTYPTGIKCRWTFYGSGNKRAQIQFVHFKLDNAPPRLESPSSTARLKRSSSVPRRWQPKCNQGVNDVLIAYVQTAKNSQWNEIDTFCGDRFPPQLMSAGYSLRLEFIAHGNVQRSGEAFGFEANWNFVEDFGITSGTKTNKDSCHVEYSSTLTNNGTFMSPNYPGYYPRNVDCRYTFLGKPGEHVIITFTYFAIEGSQQCRNGSASDYLEFSNYKYIDRNIQRFCGTTEPPTMRSEGPFYEINFHSNSEFDGLGFRAYYQFAKKDVSPALYNVKRNAERNSHGLHLTTVLMMLIFLLR